MLEQVNEGIVFNIQHYSIHDGPGIRTLVFLKGCPLRCLWCSNPESMNPWPELGFRQSFCNGCGQCIDVCPRKALSLTQTEGQYIVEVDRATCDNCGVCVDSCPEDALTIYGQRMTLKQVIDEVSSDSAFYRKSGGGVTVSGGEPLSQPGFLLGILRECRRLGFHTAIETCGYSSSRTFKAILGEVDLVMPDLKVMDAGSHLALTGRKNHLIFNNIRLSARAKCLVQPRMPLVPVINDSEDNITMVASFLRSLGLSSIELMPYHEFGKSKYAALGRPYKMSHIAPAKPEDVERACELFKRHSIQCWASI